MRSTSDIVARIIREKYLQAEKHFALSFYLHIIMIPFHEIFMDLTLHLMCLSQAGSVIVICVMMNRLCEEKLTLDK